MTGTRASLEERLNRRTVIVENGDWICWVWTGYLTENGYGQIGRGRAHEGTVLTHVATWELVNGPVPPGKQLDHLCRNRACRRPDHLDPVTGRENVLRSPISTAALRAAQTECIHGHLLTGANVYVPPKRPTNRHCRQCQRNRKAARQAQKEVAA